MTYLALLRGVNVGGNSMIKMSELCAKLESTDLRNVSSYIQSGNLFFESSQTDTVLLAGAISKVIKDSFGLDILCVVLSHTQWQHIIQSAPNWWGKDQSWKHNIFVLIDPTETELAMQAFAKLKPDIEEAKSGQGVIYQSASLAEFGRTSSTNIVNFPVYKRLTIRNYRTAQTLLQKLEQHQSQIEH